MEEELELFADDDYKPQEIDGRTVLRLHGEQDRRKKIEADKILNIYEAMREGWYIDIQERGVNKCRISDSFLSSLHEHRDLYLYPVA